MADISAARLRQEADKAGMAIAQTLKPFGYKVTKGDPKVSRPFEQTTALVHLCETEACRIKVKLKDGSDGMLLVKMTNFAHGRAVITTQGLKYEGVEPRQNTKDERPAFRILSFRADADGKLLSVDPAMSAKGMAWSTGNIMELVGRLKEGAEREFRAAKRPIPIARQNQPVGRMSNGSPAPGMK